MDANAFRHLYEYHFTVNRKIWNQCIVPLSQEQFTRKVAHSVGSVRNQVVHLMNIDDRWFSGLRGEKIPGFLNPVHYGKRDIIRAKWDAVESKMRTYLETLCDDLLKSQPFLALDGDPIALWQVLIHVANHGTDHRAKLLTALDELGVKTFGQDYAYFIMGRM
jgi:uncharacterized damage-inducible protein DinB